MIHKKPRPLRPLPLVPLAVAVIAFGPLALGLNGCAKLFTEAPRPLYRISAPSDFPARVPHVAAQFVVDMPYAPAALDTQRIAVSKSPVTLDYLADGDWVDRAPGLMQTALIEAFENSKAVGGVGPQALGLRADFVIESDMRHFEVVYDSPAAGGEGTPIASVALAVKLVKVPEHKILAESMISAREPAAANATPQIAVAFNTAVASVAKQVVSWAVDNSALPAQRR
jgi:cholesterol transport system auxiliary component